MKFFIAITCLLALAIPSRGHGDVLPHGHGHGGDYYSYPSYAFDYHVRDPHTHDNKNQWERREGDNVVGGFTFVEPGGSIRVVEYRADHTGFINSVLKRIGPKVHPGGAVSQIGIQKPLLHGHGHVAPVHEPYRYAPQHGLGYGQGYGHGYGHGLGYGHGYGAH